MIVQILLCKSVCIFSSLCDRKRLFRVPASIIKYQDFEFEPALESFKGGRRYSQYSIKRCNVGHSSQYSLCIPSQEKISSEGQNVCTVYFQERYWNIYRHRIAITITTASDAIDGEVQKEGVVVMKLQSCEFILRFSLFNLKCTSMGLSQ